ncbi:uncharacterized protein PAC_19498 [Phialocephala subalpina]|uniref:Heterokaryon incompatibility domain-containing protein n=1 Tax=Phialocephala subalpina TaxID=576137 RepID=A0A1L7XX67_9HELO|nr:uncharacterized protein PAC_19498 [Phialocephala subalpina]
MPLTSPSSTYTYRPVDAAHQGFRIAILEGSPDFEAPIRCSLVEVSVPVHPDYEAISYVWGDLSNQAYLEVEGETLMVTANLVLALRYIRHETEARYVWADAICIDQSNLEERGQQVQLMKDVYTLCTRDLIWLGESDERSEKGIGTLIQMQRLRMHRRGDTDSFGKKVSRDKIGYQEELSVYHILKTPKIWERVWVMQEISCCPDALILIGHHSMPWDVLSGILDHSGIPDRFHAPMAHGSPDSWLWEIIIGVQVIEHQRGSVKGIHLINSTLVDVLSRFRQTYSTDPRDKIYCLLGLATDGHGIVPDYRKPVGEVYTHIAWQQIQKEQNMDMITQSLWPLGPDAGTADLPSWLPNFSSTASKTPLFAQRDIFAAGPAKFIKSVNVTSSGKLRVYGVFLGKIKTLKKPNFRALGLGTIMGGINPAVAQYTLPPLLSTSSASDIEYPTGGDAFEAYWRTLMADCDLYPARRLSNNDITKYNEIFKCWRRNLALNVKLPNVVDNENQLADERQKEEYRSRCDLQGIQSLSQKLGNWRFAELENDLYSLVPCDGCLRMTGGAAEEGDSVILVDGGKVPLAIRRVPNDNSKVDEERWEVLGTAYVHGYMDNGWRLIDEEVLKWVPITLV